MKAGFDLSEITVVNWKALLYKFNICHESVKTEKGWVWWQHGSDNVVVTANNPLTGLYYHDRGGSDEPVIGYCGYIGIEGDSSFVADFFVAFKELCEYYKDEDFGNRSFI